MLYLQEKQGKIAISQPVHAWLFPQIVQSRAKTTKGRRTIVLPALALDALNKHRLQQNEVGNHAGASWQENDLVFCSRNGNFLYPDNEVQCFQKLLENGGITPHALS